MPAEVHRTEKPVEQQLLRGLLGACGGTLEDEQLDGPDALLSGWRNRRLVGGGEQLLNTRSETKSVSDIIIQML